MHLAKLLAMTTSANDHEALTAVRKANEYLASCKASWHEVLRDDFFNTVNISIQRAPPPASAYQEQDGWMPPHLNDRAVIEMMFRAVYAMPRSDDEEFWQFMDSIHQRWKDHSNLTPNMYTALRKSYNRAIRASGS